MAASTILRPNSLNHRQRTTVRFAFRDLKETAMKLHRRGFFHFAAGAAALSTRFAWAQTYPSRPVHVMVGYPPGGAADIISRLIGQWLSERLGQPFVTENGRAPAAILPPKRS